MGVLHFFCCGDEYLGPHDPARQHSPHPSQFHDGGAHHPGHDHHPHPHDQHHQHHGHDHHPGHDHDHHHQHYQNLRRRVPTHRQDCLNSRGNGTPGCGLNLNTGLRNPADHGNVGGMCHGQRGLSPHPNPFKRNCGDQVLWGNTAGGVQTSNVQMHPGPGPGPTNPVPNTPQQNHDNWEGANGNNVGQMSNGTRGNRGTSPWSTGPSHPVVKPNHVTWGGANGGNPNAMSSQWHAGAGVHAAHDGEVMSYNITIHKHIKGGGGYTKVNKNDIQFQL